LQSNKVFSKNITDQARNIEFDIDKEKKIGYGFGWFIEENDTLEKVFHSGSNGGFRTYSFSIPSAGYLIVIFSNRDDLDLETLVQKIVKLQWGSALSFTGIESITS
jgi:CubicO group peptidase (beta-lactamase class C family)